MHKSSAHDARCGSQSENAIPDFPYCRNGRWLAHTFAVGLMKAKRSPFRIDSGSGSPFSFSSAGFGSNRSSWLGPPVHEKEDHVLRPRRELRLPRCQRIRRLRARPPLAGH